LPGRPAPLARLFDVVILFGTAFQSLIHFIGFDLCGGDRLAGERHYEAPVNFALHDFGVRA
jgi:hypothetical protein